MVGGVTSGLTRGGLCTQYLPDLQGVPSDTTVAVRGVTNTFHLGFEACFTEGNPYLALNQMPRSGEAVATLILPNSPIVKLPSKYLIFVYTHCSQPWSKKKKTCFCSKHRRLRTAQSTENKVPVRVSSSRRDSDVNPSPRLRNTEEEE